MNDRWTELARQARLSRKGMESEQMPFGFAESVLRRLSGADRNVADEGWVALLRPALGLAFATAVLCVLLQVRAQNEMPPNLLVETENLIRFAVLE